MSDHRMNISSLAVSAVALISLFELCLKGCDVVSGASTTSESCQQFLSKVDIERRRLAIWGRRWGLVSHDVDRVEHDLNIADTRQIIHDSLTSIERIVCDVEELEKKYGLDVAALIPSGAADILPATFEGFEGNPSRQPAVSAALATWQSRIQERQQRLSVLSKLSYSFTDEAKLGSLAQDLSWYVSRLWELLMSEKLLGIERCLSAEVLSTATTERRLQLIGATTDGTNSVTARHAQNQLLARSLERAAVGAQPGRYRHERKYAPSVVQIKSPTQRDALSRCIANFLDETIVVGKGSIRRPVPVLLEWKQGNWPASLAAEMEKRVDNLAVMLGRVKSSIEGENYRVLECLGYFEDRRPNTFGIFYRLPKAANPFEEPISLYRLLGTGNEDLDRMPSLDCRVNLALRLAISLHEFHSSGWLHKQITSDNIVFFKSETSPILTESDLHRPYLVGFAVSRPSNDPRGTEEKIPAQQSTRTTQTADDLYRHPSQASSPSTRQHDIYSLGLVLLEIARWNRLETMIADRTEAQNTSHQQALSCAVEIDFDVGRAYSNVVRTLLRNVDESAWTVPQSLYSHDRTEGELEDGNTDADPSEGKVLRDFYYSVIAKLVCCL
jgi:hypothetical protein